MATSASTLNQEGEVTSVVEIEGTPLAAGDKGAAVEVAATDFQSFLKEPAEVADPELLALLRKHDVDERLILEIGSQGVKTIADFVGLEGTEAEMRNTRASSFGINGSTVKGKVAIGGSAERLAFSFESGLGVRISGCPMQGPWSACGTTGFRVSSVHRFSCSLSRRSSGR